MSRRHDSQTGGRLSRERLCVGSSKGSGVSKEENTHSEKELGFIQGSGSWFVGKSVWEALSFPV